MVNNTLTPERRAWIGEATIAALVARRDRLLHLVGSDEQLVAEDELKLIDHEVLKRTSDSGSI